LEQENQARTTDFLLYQKLKMPKDKSFTNNITVETTQEMAQIL